MPGTIHDQQYLELISRLRKARRISGISQDDLAAKMDRPQSFVSKVETAERRIDILELLDLCSALEVTLKDVLPPALHKAAGFMR